MNDTTLAVPYVPERRGRASRWRALLRRLRPRGSAFFELFEQHAGLCAEGLRTLVLLLGDLDDAPGRVREIEAIEKRADGVVDAVADALHRALLPPFPAEAIHELANALDDIVDLTEDAAESIHLYHVTRVTPEAVRLAELAVACADKLREAVRQLADLRQGRAVFALCLEVDALEAQADHVMRAAMSRLFREEADARDLVKLKAVYEVLEGLTDKCKDAANVIEALVLKHG
jgi:hypothetical protein